MVEPEMAFANIHDAMDNAEGYIKYVVREVLNHCQDDLLFFEKFHDKLGKEKNTSTSTSTSVGLVQRLKKLAGITNTDTDSNSNSNGVDEAFARIEYKDAIRILQDAATATATAAATTTGKNKNKAYAKSLVDPASSIVFGSDISTEQEKWLADVYFEGKPVFVYNYPSGIKSFYMRDNDIHTSDSGGGGGSDSEVGQTCASFDLLVPGVGELVGGSQREERLDVLLKKMEQHNLKPEDYWWYLDLRRYGSTPHSGYGLGFERLVCYVTSIENIRDAIAFPRYPGHADF
jgi:asparaginyl-tRNA synthetase